MMERNEYWFEKGDRVECVPIQHSKRFVFDGGYHPEYEGTGTVIKLGNARGDFTVKWDTGEEAEHHISYIKLSQEHFREEKLKLLLD